jgi:NAD(P)-dependent dehydrogenase (short-subunit alcohol dehydrogenase family)
VIWISSFCLNAAFKKKAIEGARNMSGKILVIGATGNVGAPLVAELVARGEKVKAATRNTAKARQIARGR